MNKMNDGGITNSAIKCESENRLWGFSRNKTIEKDGDASPTSAIIKTFFKSRPEWIFHDSLGRSWLCRSMVEGNSQLLVILVIRLWSFSSPP